jgi:hypothetical protein
MAKLNESMHYMPRTVTIDDDVWQELQKRARAFEDTPNTVMRRLIGLPETRSDSAPRSTESPIGEGPTLDAARDPRLDALLSKAGLSNFSGGRVDGARWAGRLGTGPIVAYIAIQKKALKLEVKKRVAEERGLTGDRVQPGGWFGIDASVFWYVRNSSLRDEDRAASVLQKLFAVRTANGVRLAALRASAGGWDGLIDGEALKKRIYKDRQINTRPEPAL